MLYSVAIYYSAVVIVVVDTQDTTLLDTVTVYNIIVVVLVDTQDTLPSYNLSSINSSSGHNSCNVGCSVQ